MKRYISFLAFSCGAALSFAALANDGSPIPLEVSSGTVSFEVATNVPGVEESRGKTNALTAHLQVESSAEGLALLEMEFVVPVARPFHGYEGSR